MKKNANISLYIFESLDSTEKLDQTYFQGVFLTERTVVEFIIELYALNNFFVEIWYGGLNEGETPFVKIKSFKSIKLLEPYLFSEASFKLLKSLNC